MEPDQGSTQNLMSTQLVQPGVDILRSTQLLKHRQEVEQLGIVHVVKPRQHRNLQRTRPARCHSSCIYSNLLNVSLSLNINTRTKQGVLIGSIRLPPSASDPSSHAYPPRSAGCWNLMRRRSKSSITRVTTWISFTKASFGQNSPHYWGGRCTRQESCPGSGFCADLGPGGSGL